MKQQNTLPGSWLKIQLGDVIDYGETEKVEPEEISASAWVLELEDIEKDTSKILQRLNFAQRNSKSTKTRFQKGDVLYGKLRPYLNKVVIAEQDGYCTTEIVPLRPNLAVNGKYLFYWLKGPVFRDYASFVSHGLNMPRLGTVAGQNAPFILPPLAEQKRIADKLDALIARVDACRAHLDRVPEILMRFRQAVLAAAVSGQLFKDNEKDQAGNKRISEAIDRIKTGPFGSALHKSDYISNGIPLVNPTHIINGLITPSADTTISPEMAEQLSEFRLTTGDVILARRGIMGRCAVVKPEQNGWLCGSGSMILHPKREVLPAYLQIFLSSPSTVRALEADSVGSTMSNLNQKILLDLVIRIPTLDLQHEIVQRVDKLLTYADRLEARYQAARARMDALTPTLLAKAFRGELVPQDPAAEPAAILLERIRAAREATSAQTQTESQRRPQRRERNEEPMPDRTTISPTHLTDLLKARGPLTPEKLWADSGLSIEDFYDQLKDEELRGLLRELRNLEDDLVRKIEAL